MAAARPRRARGAPAVPRLAARPEQEERHRAAEAEGPDRRGSRSCRRDPGAEADILAALEGEIRCQRIRSAAASSFTPVHRPYANRIAGCAATTTAATRHQSFRTAETACARAPARAAWRSQRGSAGTSRRRPCRRAWRRSRAATAAPSGRQPSGSSRALASYVHRGGRRRRPRSSIRSVIANSVAESSSARNPARSPIPTS